MITGKKLAESIVKEKLAACVNRVPGIALSKLHGSNNDNPLMRPGNANASYSRHTGKPSNEVIVNDALNSEDDKLHPFGLLMSKLQDGSHLRRAQSFNSSLRLGDQGHFTDPLNDRDAHFTDQSSMGGMVNPSFRGWDIVRI